MSHSQITSNIALEKKSATDSDVVSNTRHQFMEELERLLGDPRTEGHPLSYLYYIEQDEQELFPSDACAQLEKIGCHAYHVPEKDGGKLSSFEQLLDLVRTLARRDLTVAIGHGKTYLGAVSVWVGGDKEVREKLSSIVLSGKAVSLGLTEENHGADLVASGVKAEACDDGFVLEGEKWLINNATRGAALTVLARTDNKIGARSLSLFLVDKSDLDEDAYEPLPKNLTHGIRGADISGIKFKNARIPASSLIGQVGDGLEITLKGLQSSRTMCAGLSLGAADTALRTVVRFALDRRLYGDTVYQIPHARGTMADAFIDILMCECVAVAASRSLHVLTEQMSVYSSAVKYFVPFTIERTLQHLAVILGARHYLREKFEWGIFQKLLRDHALVSLFDGSSVVNLSGMSVQLRQLAARRASKQEKKQGISEELKTVFDLSRSLPEFDAGRMSISNRGQDDVTESLDAVLVELEALSKAAGSDQEVVSQLIELARTVIEVRNGYEKSVLESNKRGSHADSRYFHNEEAYCNVYVAAICLQVWLNNRKSLNDYFIHGSWLVLCLKRLLGNLGRETKSEHAGYVEEAAEEMVRIFKEDKLFSILPVTLGKGSPC